MNTPRFYFLLAVACSLILFFAVSVPSAHAGVWDQATKVTFSAPVEVPGMVLPAGTYWFSLLNDDSDRNICVIWNTNRTRVMANILTVPDYREHSTGKPVVSFEERASSQPEAIEAWFYPGDRYGHEFVYPKSRATALAARVGRPVLSMPDEVGNNIRQPATSASAPSVKAMKQANVTAMNSSGQEVDKSAAAQTTPSSQTAQQR